MLSAPGANVGTIPLTAFPKGLSFQALMDLNFVRGYVESYSVALQQDFGHG